ncbi:MAG TPA: CAP domain-containing protein, partial [Symbiobacteriaceae bacterium]|nr:CAP domain-containing protein [Symbiobacteriaceae bacterium]
MKFSRMTAVAVSAALLSTLAFAAPASAATCPTKSAGAPYTYAYRTVNWVGLWNMLASRAPMAQAAPAAQAPAPQTLAKAPVTQAAAPAAKPAVAPAPAQTTAGLTAEEQQMLNLVNSERAKAGLPALKADLEMTKVARLKSQDMIDRNYFSHQSPTYGSPFDMLTRFGVSYRTAGENIAGNGSVSGAHTSLMNSSGHRANIL